MYNRKILIKAEPSFYFSLLLSISLPRTHCHKTRLRETCYLLHIDIGIEFFSFVFCLPGTWFTCATGLNVSRTFTFIFSHLPKRFRDGSGAIFLSKAMNLQCYLLLNTTRSSTCESRKWATHSLIEQDATVVFFIRILGLCNLQATRNKRWWSGGKIT